MSYPLTASPWDRLKVLYQAASLVDPNFKLMAMPDSTTSGGSDINLLADKMAELAAMPASFKLPYNRFAASPFAPEALGITDWQDFINLMAARGVQVAFVWCFSNTGANVATFAPISYGFSDWGTAARLLTRSWPPTFTTSQSRQNLDAARVSSGHDHILGFMTSTKHRKLARDLVCRHPLQRRLGANTHSE